jgi:predicted AlkP superfamily phosphohydrolase/phosphomutase
MRICLIKLSPDGFLKARLLFDALNPLIVQPAGLSDALERAVGPMVDFPDNWPAQLNKLPEEKDVLLAEARMALDWHRRAARRLLSVEKPDVLIQDTYAPNQILESRWWLKRVDPAAPAYAATPEGERRERERELLSIYQGIDAVLGEAVKKAGPGAVIALSSDHGILPIKKEVLLNNLLAREGLLKFSIDPASGEPVVDWAGSKAAFLKMIGIYVNPAGLAGDWKRGSGPAYEALRSRVAALVAGVADGGTPVAARAVPWERAGELRLPKDRCPDLVLAMSPGYALTEDMDNSGEVLREPVQSGYKQAVPADHEPSLWTPFVIMGPGIKKGFRLPQPIRNADQEPTLLKALGLAAPAHVQGEAADVFVAPR